jgi:CheY-like chemotaxis protein
MDKLEPFTILLVEDDPADQKLIKTSLLNQKVANDLHIADCGEDALDYLHHRGEYSSGTPRPELILLDLNMPGMGGKEFLRQVKEDERLKQLPVIILTTSESERDIIDSYNLQASGYVNKPVSLDDFKKVMETIGEYWLMLCKRPPKSD